MNSGADKGKLNHKAAGINMFQPNKNPNFNPNSFFRIGISSDFFIGWLLKIDVHLAYACRGCANRLRFSIAQLQALETHVISQFSRFALYHPPERVLHENHTGD
jgi:hypothetical protein